MLSNLGMVTVSGRVGLEIKSIQPTPVLKCSSLLPLSCGPAQECFSFGWDGTSCVLRFHVGYDDY